LLVLGAGPDAEPVVRFAAELGWRCTVVDHRDAYIDTGSFGGAEKVLCAPANELADTLDLSCYDAAVVMSHHLASDRAYLKQLAATEMRYVGLLGPAARRDRLLSELGEAGRGLEGRLRGPAGISIGGRGPAAIALSIVAEVQGVLQGRIS
jgi:xanthine dehydrogenase accessory factor